MKKRKVENFVGVFRVVVEYGSVPSYQLPGHFYQLTSRYFMSSLGNALMPILSSAPVAIRARAYKPGPGIEAGKVGHITYLKQESQQAAWLYGRVAEYGRNFLFSNQHLSQPMNKTRLKY